MAEDLKERADRKSESGMTLMELIIVLVILGMLTAVAAPKIFNQMGRSRNSVAKVEISNLEQTLSIFSFDFGRFPSTSEGLQALVQNPTGTSNWQGPYLKKAVPMDPWSRPYVYKSPGDHGDYDLCSMGADGVAGNEDDICNWQ